MVHEDCILAIMQYRKLKADNIFDGFNWMDRDKVLILDQYGVVQDIVIEEDAGEEIDHLKGILCPGFINAHCHLELSHFKNVVPPHTGLIEFLLTVIKTRGAGNEEILDHIILAEKEMYDNGTVAIIDICNTDHTISIKKQSKLQWYNLIEVINLHDENLGKRLQHFNDILQKFKVELDDQKSILTPHAPYSISTATLKALNNATANSIISIHNQESAAENELFLDGKGNFLNFFTALGQTKSPFEISTKTSLQTWLPYFTNGQTILLVHNTFISEEDVVFAKMHAEQYNLKLVYCLCPNANLYIENRLPPIDLLIKHSCKIVLGTDSYSSNTQLNIAAEIKTLSDKFPNLPINTIMLWATSNGASILHQSLLGSLENGKRPGIVLLETNPVNEKITGRCKRLV